jgi:uncharacterized delta-60 repeat protein
MPMTAALAIALFPAIVQAQGAGALDQSFGTGGIVTTDFAGAGDGAFAIAVQTDGKLVAAGQAFINDASNFALARYNSNGTLDAGFGAGGRASTNFGGRFESPTSVALQADGKVVVAGGSVISLFNDFAVARFNSNGTLDTSFGTGGKVLTDFGVSAQAESVAVQPDGKIVVAGFANVNGGYNFELVRYNSDGTLDASFGTGGKVTTDFGLRDQGFSFAQGNSVLLQHDGKIVLAGVAFMSSAYNFALARYNPNGTLDNGFGAAGKVITNFPTSTSNANVAANSIALQPDGKIVAAGLAGFDIALARYSSSGALDTSFGTGGRVTTDVAGSYDHLSSVALQPDAKIVGAGSTVINGDFHSALLRYNSNGTLDTTFGTGGKVINIFGVQSEGASAIAVQPDGKIVAAGGANINGTTDFALARFNSGGGSSTPPPTSGFTPIRVNAGGPAYTDATGNLWAADTNTTGSTFGTSATIGNTTTMALYQTERWSTSPLQYVFAAPNATYTVTLKFAEIYFTTCGHRIFNIAINGTTVDANFDPCAAGGGPNMAVDRVYTVPVSGGQIAITLTPVLDNPKISAIEIR